MKFCRKLERQLQQTDWGPREGNCFPEWFQVLRQHDALGYILELFGRRKSHFEKDQTWTKKQPIFYAVDRRSLFILQQNNTSAGEYLRKEEIRNEIKNLGINSADKKFRKTKLESRSQSYSKHTQQNISTLLPRPMTRTLIVSTTSLRWRCWHPSSPHWGLHSPNFWIP